MFIDINVLQPFPSSNPNRDDMGRPKTAMYGGVLRHRVSSQSWKRAVRERFKEFYPREYLGLRSQRTLELIAESISEQEPELASKAMVLAKKVFEVAGITLEDSDTRVDEKGKPVEEVSFLFFVSPAQIRNIAEIVIERDKAGKHITKAMLKKTLTEENTVDIALFGRMVANFTDANIDAACQVSHALSTHSVETEFDYFTAVDDVKAEAEKDRSLGAGMIGTVEFVSSCLYRFATINTDLLTKNLDSTVDAKVAVEAFINAFVTSIPKGMINTFANHTLPSAVYVAIRDDQPMSLAGAFETPVKTDLGGGYVKKSVDQLVEYAEAIYGAYGEPVKDFACAADPSAKEISELAESIPLKNLAGSVAEAVFPQGD